MGLLTSLLNTTISVDFNFTNPTRSHHLQTKLAKKLKHLPSFTRPDLLYHSLRVLSHDDFVIFSHPENEEYYLQFVKNQSDLIMDYPYSVTDQRIKLLHRVEYVLYTLKFKNTLTPWQQLGQNYQGYYHHVPNQYGTSLEAHCGPNIKLAATLTEQMLTEVYRLPPTTLPTVTLDSWKKWWL